MNEVDKKIIEMYQRGDTWKKISEDLGVNLYKIHIVLKDNGLTHRRRDRQEDLKRAVEMYENGMSVNKIRDTLKISYPSLYRYLSEYFGVNSLKRYAYDADEVTSYHQEYLDGYSIMDISKKHNIPYSTLRSAFIDLGFKGENRRKCPIVMLDMQGRYLREYDSVKEAGADNDIDYRRIYLCTSGRKKSEGGYKWMKLKEFSESF